MNAPDNPNFRPEPTHPDRCICPDCFDSETACRCDCDPGGEYECTGCRSAREELRDAQHDIDVARGLK
jgi:hypothetical protein